MTTKLKTFEIFDKFLVRNRKVNGYQIWLYLVFLYQVASIIYLGSNGGGYKFYMGLYREKFRILPVRSREAEGYQILHVALSSGPLPRMPKL